MGGSVLALIKALSFTKENSKSPVTEISFSLSTLLLVISVAFLIGGGAGYIAAPSINQSSSGIPVRDTLMDHEQALVVKHGTAYVDMSLLYKRCGNNLDCARPLLEVYQINRKWLEEILISLKSYKAEQNYK